MDGAEVVDYWSSDFFNGELYSDQSLNSLVNNSVYTPSTVDPISTVTGNVYHDEQDLRIRGRGGMDYVFTRTYNSGPTKADPSGVPIGHKWSHSYNMRLIARDHGKEPNADLPEDSDGSVSSIIYVDERGGESIYGVSGTGLIASWTVDNPRGVFDTLDLSQAPGLYILRFRNGTEYHFGSADLSNTDAVAQLQLIRDPYGNQLSFGYLSGNLITIQDNLGVVGRTGLVLTYFPDGRLETITDWTGRIWRYTYDAAGNLKTFDDPLTHVTAYDYAPDSHLLIEVAKPADRDQDGTRDVRTSFDYYANARGFSNADSFGAGEQADYDLFRKRTRITGPRGFVTSHFYNENGELAKLTRPDGGVLTYHHTADGRRWSKTSAMGFTTQYSYCTARTVDGCVTDPGAGGNVTLERDPRGNTIEYDYDTGLFDNLTRRQDKNGAEEVRSYYSADDPITGAKRGRLHERRLAVLTISDTETLTDVLLQEFTYHPDGNIWQQIDHIEPGNPSRTRTTTFTYSPDGLELREALVAGTDGTTQRREFTYDSLGRLKTETLWRRPSATNAELEALTTTYGYDGADRVTSVTDPIGSRTETDYDANGQVEEARFIGVDPETGAVQPTRIVERRFYDDADRLIEVRDVYDKSTTFGYDEAGNQTRITDPTNASRYLDYDSRNRVVAIRDENGHRNQLRYDLDGRLIAEIDPNGNKTSYGYDELGRRTSRTDALDNLTTYRYDAVGNQIGATTPRANVSPTDPTLINALGESESRFYNELGQLIRVTDADDYDTKFEYDLLGNLVKVTDAKLQVTEFIYDDLGRLTEVIDPVVESPDRRQQFGLHDEAGNVLLATNRAGDQVRLTYDALNRPVLREYLTSGFVESLAYDAFGNLRELTNPQVTYTYLYDDKDRLKTQTDSRLGRSLGFVYDDADRVIEKTDYQGDVTHFQYDGTGRLVSEDNDEYLQVSYHYDDAGRLLNRILSNGAQTNYTYDAANRLGSIAQLTADGTVVHSVSFTPDANGNIELADDATYSYDALDRLLTVDHDGTALDRTYTYDAVGNRDSAVTSSGFADYIYGAGNRLLEIRDAGNALLHEFHYDDNGAVVGKTDGAGNPIYMLIRNDRGQVELASGPGSLVFYGYDPRGLRVARDSQLYHLEGDHLEAVYAPDGSLLAKYLRGAVIDEVVNAYQYDESGKPANYTFHHDQVSSVVALSGHTGTVEQTLAYYPFGEEQASTNSSLNSLLFTGRERDPDTGLYYYRARYYDPEIGRFLSEDPLGFDGGDVNLYAYVGNNPLRFNDPSGKVLDTALDVGFIAFDLAVIANEGLTLTNALALGADIAGAALPFVTGGGAAVRALSSRTKGRIGEFLGEATVRLRGDSVVGRQVTFDAPSARTRVDLIAETPSGLVCVECKFGPSAALTRNQRLAFPEIQAGGAIPRGQNAANAGLEVGQALGPIPVEVLHFNRTQLPSAAGGGAAFNATRILLEDVYAK